MPAMDKRGSIDAQECLRGCMPQWRHPVQSPHLAPSTILRKAKSIGCLRPGSTFDDERCSSESWRSPTLAFGASTPHLNTAHYVWTSTIQIGASRSSSRMSDIYSRMFPDPPSLPWNPKLSAPIQTLDLRQPPIISVSSDYKLDEAGNVDETISMISLQSSTSLTPPMTPTGNPSKSAVDSRLSMDDPYQSSRAPLTPPYTPARGDLILEEEQPLGSPFSPGSLGRGSASQRIDSLIQFETCSNDSMSDVPAYFGHASSLSIHSATSPLYKTHSIPGAPPSLPLPPLPLPHTPSPQVYAFPSVPGGVKISPRPFSIASCNNWIMNLEPSPSPRPRKISDAGTDLMTISELELAIRSTTPRDSIELRREQEERANGLLDEHPYAKDAMAPLAEHSEYAAEPEAPMPSQTNEMNAEEEESIVLPDLNLPDWTLGIPIGEDLDFNNHRMQLFPLPIRSILREESKERLPTQRSVKWAPDDTLAQTRYISVDGSVLCVDGEGIARPLTAAEQHRQHAYSQLRVWV